MDNVKTDTYKLINVFNFITLCNYPEAFLTPTIDIKDFTVFLSDHDDIDFTPPYFLYSGPGNVTATNWNVTGVYNLAAQFEASSFMSVTATCNPEDDLLKVFDINGLTSSLEDNADMSKTNVFAIDVDLDSYRLANIDITEFNTYNDHSGIYGPLGIGGTYTTNLTFSNSYSTDFDGTFFLFYFQRGSKFS